MSMIADELRPFWLPGLNRVVGTPSVSLTGLLGGQGYQIHSALTTNAATLYFSDWNLVASAFACELAQSAMAAIETIESAAARGRLPKSTGWLLIKCYYAGFFATQAIQRMLGRGIMRVDTSSANGIQTIATLFGMQGATAFSAGLYRFQANHPANTLTITKLDRSLGSHVAHWTVAIELIRTLGEDILAAPTASADSVLVAAKLSEIEQLLTDAGRLPRGSWLSEIRNSVNYQQTMQAWYPYTGQPRFYSDLERRLLLWRSDPELIALNQAPSRDATHFVEACAFLVSLCRVLVLDMTKRTPEGKSFHHTTTVRLLRQLQSA